MFTVKDLYNEMDNEVDKGSVCRIRSGKYDLSVGFGNCYYCTPCARVEVSLYSKVEVALFKNDNWVFPNEMKTINGFLWSNLFSPPTRTLSGIVQGVITPNIGYESIAKYVPVQTVCDIVNFLRNMETTVSSIVETPCCICGRQNDIGVNICWFCGNNPKGGK